MKTKAYLYIVSGAALWGFIGLFVNILAARGFTPMQIVALRAVAAAIGITLVLFKLGRQYFVIDWRDLWLFCGTGVISLTFFNYCYFNCMQASSLAVAALLLYTAPIFVMLMSLALFKERFTSIKALALAATFIGCAFITGALSDGASITMGALAYGLGSGVGYALYSIFCKLAIRKYSTATITAYTFYCGALSAVPLAGFSADQGVWDVGTLAASAGIGVLCAVVPYLLYTRGLEEVEAGQASILATIEPFVAAGIGIFVLGEPLTLQKGIGMLLILTSVIILNLPDLKRARS